jgi:hypothetical protein
LHGQDQELRWKAPWILSNLVQVNPEARATTLQMLTARDPNVRNVVKQPISDLLVKLASEEQQPAQFLLEHLEGQRSLLSNENADTNATYRDVIVNALAQWLVSDLPKAKQDHDSLMQRLDQMHLQDRRRHLRIAAWQVLYTAIELRNRPKDFTQEGLAISNYFRYYRLRDFLDYYRPIGFLDY